MDEFEKIMDIANLKNNIETWIEELSSESHTITNQEDLDTIVRRCEYILADAKKINSLLETKNVKREV